MLLYVVDEVLSFREKRGFLHRRELLPIKLLLLATSIAIPLAVELNIAAVYTVSLWLLLLLAGLRRTALYIALSTAILFTSFIPVTLALQGSLLRVVRSLLAAASTLSIGVFTLATLQPKQLGWFTPTYLLLVVLNSVLREVRDVHTVLRARGETGYRYYLRLFTASIEIALSRANTLIDSLKSRGIEVSD